MDFHYPCLKVYDKRLWYHDQALNLGTLTQHQMILITLGGSVHTSDSNYSTKKWLHSYLVTEFFGCRKVTSGGRSSITMPSFDAISLSKAILFLILYFTLMKIQKKLISIFSLSKIRNGTLIKITHNLGNWPETIPPSFMISRWSSMFFTRC